MKAQEIKHKVLLEEWKEKVTQCRSSGMSVRAWCREQGISYKTYYNWEKEVLTEAARQMRKQEEYVENRLVKIPALSEVTAGTDTAPALTARLRINGRELEVYKGLEEGVLLHAE